VPKAWPDDYLRWDMKRHINETKRRIVAHEGRQLPKSLHVGEAEFTGDPYDEKGGRLKGMKERE